MSRLSWKATSSIGTTCRSKVVSIPPSLFWCFPRAYTLLEFYGKYPNFPKSGENKHICTQLIPDPSPPKYKEHCYINVCLVTSILCKQYSHLLLIHSFSLVSALKRSGSLGTRLPLISITNALKCKTLGTYMYSQYCKYVMESNHFIIQVTFAPH